MSNDSYAKKLIDPRWQKKRLEVLSRDDFACVSCGDKKSTLHVHHRYYISGRMPWEYPDFCFKTLCKTCHADTAQEGRDDDGNYFPLEWEAGLNYFGENLFDMMAMDACGNWPHNLKRLDFPKIKAAV